RVFRLADGALVDQGDRLALVFPLVGLGNRLQETEIDGPVSAHHVPLERRRVFGVLDIEARGQLPGDAAGVAAEVEDDGRRVFQLLKHGVDLRHFQAGQINVAEVVGQYLEDLAFARRDGAGETPRARQLHVPVLAVRPTDREFAGGTLF